MTQSNNTFATRCTAEFAKPGLVDHENTPVLSLVLWNDLMHKLRERQ